jgi:hypothetical protein
VVISVYLQFLSPKGGYFRIPTISSSPSDWYDPTATQALYKQQANIMKIGEAAGTLAKTIKDKSDRKKQGKKYQENIENLPDVYEKWKKNNPAGDAERFKEEHYDLVNDYMKQNRHMGFTIEKT